MFRYSFALGMEAQAIENAVLATLEQGYRTYDIMSEGNTKVGTKQMGDLVAQRVKG
jgi:3-isopropylmalate dehydrogenase